MKDRPHNPSAESAASDKSHGRLEKVKARPGYKTFGNQELSLKLVRLCEQLNMAAVGGDLQKTQKTALKLFDVIRDINAEF